MPSSIETHPQRKKIIDAILSGRSDREIARSITPKLSHVAVWAYRKNVVKPALQNASMTTKILHGHGLTDENLAPTPAGQAALTLTEQALKDDVVLNRAEELWREVGETIREAKKARYITQDKLGNEVVLGRDFSPMAPLIGRAHENIRLMAELTGRLKGDGLEPITIVIAMPSAPTPINASQQPEQLALGAVEIDVRR